METSPIDLYQKNIEIWEDMVSRCQTQLADFQNITEVLYKKIGDHLPKIDKEMRESNEEARLLIGYFLSGGDISGAQGVIGDTILKTRGRFSTISKFFFQMKEREAPVPSLQVRPDNWVSYSSQKRSFRICDRS